MVLLPLLCCWWIECQCKIYLPRWQDGFRAISWQIAIIAIKNMYNNVLIYWILVAGCVRKMFLKNTHCMYMCIKKRRAITENKIENFHLAMHSKSEYWIVDDEIVDNRLNIPKCLQKYFELVYFRILQGTHE